MLAIEHPIDRFLQHSPLVPQNHLWRAMRDQPAKTIIAEDETVVPIVQL